MNLEKYTEELLKGYCEKKPSSKKAFSKHLNIVKAYSLKPTKSENLNLKSSNSNAPFSIRKLFYQK